MRRKGRGRLGHLGPPSIGPPSRGGRGGAGSLTGDEALGLTVGPSPAWLVQHVHVVFHPHLHPFRLDHLATHTHIHTPMFTLLLPGGTAPSASSAPGSCWSTPSPPAPSPSTSPTRGTRAPFGPRLSHAIPTTPRTGVKIVEKCGHHGAGRAPCDCPSPAISHA